MRVIALLLAIVALFVFLNVFAFQYHLGNPFNLLTTFGGFLAFIALVLTIVSLYVDSAPDTRKNPPKITR